MEKKRNIGSLLILPVAIITFIFLVLITRGGAEGPIQPYIMFSFLMLALTVIVTLVVALKGLFSNKKALKQTVIFIVLALVIFFVGKFVFMSSDIPVAMTDKGADQGTWDSISGGLFLTAVLLFAALGLMVWDFLKDIVKK